jgi:hypothetical protein
MRRLLIATAVSSSLLTGCYTDDATHSANIAPTVVYLTDAPFPFDSIGSVNIYVTRIEASAVFDTSGAGNWVEVAAPRKTFDLLALQQGTTANLGAGFLDAGQYTAIRMTIDVDKSSIKYPNGTDAIVHWPGTGEITIHTLVEDPVAVTGTGAEIVIDFDVGRSFQYRMFGADEFNVFPSLRAVNKAATGTIEGTVTAPANVGPPGAVANANVSVYRGDPSTFGIWYIEATGHTDQQGHYKIAFLPAGNYTVRVEQPIQPAFAASEIANVAVTIGNVTTHNVLLARADAGLHITGNTIIGVGGTTLLHAATNDSSGNSVGAAVTWVSRSPGIAATVDSVIGDSLDQDKFVLGLQEGSAWIVATSGALMDSVLIQVVAQPNPNGVATVTVSPPTLDLQVGDSTFLLAEVRDSLGNVLTNRQIAWLPADSSGVVELLLAVGPTAVLKAKIPGTVVIRALSEGKTGSATVTVH